MNKLLKVPLSKEGLNNLLKKIDKLETELDKKNIKIVEELADYTLKEIQNNYSATPYKDGNEDMSYFSEKKNNIIKVGISGSQVLYNEFGTGEEGANDGHEMKGDFSLNPYNSGKTIRENTNADSTASQNGIPMGGLYWTYKDKQGNKVYTQGIPAGKQVFNASISLRKYKKKILKQEVSDVLSKL
jgi:hypothetical protein